MQNKYNLNIPSLEGDLFDQIGMYLNEIQNYQSDLPPLKKSVFKKIGKYIDDHRELPYVAESNNKPAVPFWVLPDKKKSHGKNLRRYVAATGGKQ